MFDLDQPKIAKYGRANCDNFAAVLRFVVITIQNRLHNCPADCDVVNEALTGEAGDDIERARYYPRDREFLTELEPTVTHYEVLEAPGE